MNHHDYEKFVDSKATKERDLTISQAQAATHLLCALSALCRVAELLKKHYYHGAQLDRDIFRDEMDSAIFWIKELSRSGPGDKDGLMVRRGQELDSIFSQLGMYGEMSELTDKLLTFMEGEYDPNTIDKEIRNEMGDARFYWTDLVNVMCYSSENITRENVNKLDRRYPNGYSHEAAAAKADQAGVTVAEAADNIFQARKHLGGIDAKDQD